MAGLDLTGKVALITGSTRGIGFAIAEKLAEHGATIVLNGRSDSEALHKAAASIKERYGVQAMGVAADVANSTEVSAMVRSVFSSHKRLDILINNAGVLRDNLIGMISEEDIQQTISINLLGVLYCIRAASRLMARKGGSIINISSIIGARGNSGQLVYSASKGGVISATLSAAKELAASNVRVNAIAPGYINTDMIRSIPSNIHQERLASIAMRRIGEPEDIANTALFLASDLSSYVTGQIIGVDGGMLV